MIAKDRRAVRRADPRRFVDVLVRHGQSVQHGQVRARGRAPVGRRRAVQGSDKNLRLKDFPAFTQEFWRWRESDLSTPPGDLAAPLPGSLLG